MAVLKVPVINDALSEPTLSCPLIVLDTDLVICDLMYKSGGRIQASIDFGEGTSDTIDTLGK